MEGWAVTRTTSTDGRWVYTLYQRGGGYPFIHALDTVNGVAHCIGLPWKGDQTALASMRLTLAPDGRTLAVRWKSGRPWLTMNTADWQLAHVQPDGFAWRWAAAAAGGAILLVLASGLVLLGRRRQTSEAAPVPL